MGSLIDKIFAQNIIKYQAISEQVLSVINVKISNTNHSIERFYCKIGRETGRVETQ